MERRKEQWSSKLGFVMSSAGAAIGLGAIWKFPYETGMNGGGAFFLLFVVFTILIGLPMLVSEFIIGRGSGKEAISAYKRLAPESAWPWIGKLGVAGCFLLLSFYSVVGGWVFVYSFLSVQGKIIQEGASYSAQFGSIVSSPSTTLIGLLAFTIINVLVISLGVQNGIEKANKYMMPLLFLFFIILVVRSLTLAGAMEGVSFFLKPDFSSISKESVLYALGQSFFSLAVGFSCMVTYSSYLKKDVSLTSAATSVVGMNLFVSLLAGLAIFPAVFAFGQEPAAGPELLFMVLPAVFSQLPFGQVFLALFLLLFLFATLTSSFSLYEIIVAALTASGKRSRKAVTWLIGFVVFIAAVPSALSSSTLSGVSLFTLSIFDATDYLVSNILLPTGSLLIALFIIRKMDQVLVREEFTLNQTQSIRFYPVWHILMKWVVPLTIIVVFLNVLGIVQ